MKWLRRYLDEKSPTLKEFAKVVLALERRRLDAQNRFVRSRLNRIAACLSPRTTRSSC